MWNSGLVRGAFRSPRTWQKPIVHRVDPWRDTLQQSPLPFGPMSEVLLPQGLSTRMHWLGKMVKEDPEARSVQVRRVAKTMEG